MEIMNPNTSSGFVGGHVIVICSYGPETVLLPVNQSTMFSDFLNCVALRFGLKAGMFDLKYSLADCPSCALCSDVDLKLMLQVLVVYEKAYVNVRVIDAAAKSVGDESNLTVESDVGFCSDNEADYLGDFRPEEAKIFLSRQWKDYIKSVDQKFVGGAREFREKLCLFAVEMGFMFRYTRNDKWRVSSVCSHKESQNCEWHVNASACPTNKFFYINQLNNVHTCSSVLRTRSHQLMSSSHVKMLIFDEFRSNPSLKTKDIINRMRNSFGIDISYRVAWIAREKALKELHGSDEESFANLIWYKAAILETNPGSVFDLELDPITGRFQRLFMCFGGVIEGFKSCIPLLFVDGAHVKSKYKGVMLSATGKDGNQGFFPFAVAVVNNETDENWNWFFGHLKAILDPQGRMITFISDRGIGLLSSLKRVFPENPHSYCLYHLKLNLADMIKGSNNKALRSTLVDKFNSLAYSHTERQYYYNLNIFLADGQDVARAFLKDLPLEKWCNAFFKGCRFGEMANSLAESFNNWTVEARELPVFPMLEAIRKKIMGIMSARKLEVQKWHCSLCPVMQKKLAKNMEVGRDWTVTRADFHVFEVHSPFSAAVDLSNQTCTCRQWQITSFPCAHACVALEKGGYDIYAFIPGYYFREEFFSSYSYGIRPIPNMEKKYWEDPANWLVKPPLTRRPPGRPKTKRIKSKGEIVVRSMTCSRCGKAERHNRTTCKAPI